VTASADRLLSVPEVAQRLGLSVAAIRAFFRRGEMSFYRLGGAVRVSEEELDRFLQARLVAAKRQLTRQEIKPETVVGFIAQAPVIRKILAHIGRRFDPLKLPGRSPPLLDDLSPDPFLDYGPQ
jgi:excisionase family DNA binding protein